MVPFRKLASTGGGKTFFIRPDQQSMMLVLGGVLFSPLLERSEEFVVSSTSVRVVGGSLGLMMRTRG